MTICNDKNNGNASINMIEVEKTKKVVMAAMQAVMMAIATSIGAKAAIKELMQKNSLAYSAILEEKRLKDRLEIEIKERQGMCYFPAKSANEESNESINEKASLTYCEILEANRKEDDEKRKANAERAELKRIAKEQKAQKKAEIAESKWKKGGKS